jgi:hypothetical protein
VSCKNCPAGKFSSATGVSSSSGTSDGCNLCPAGKKNPSGGNTPCSLCTPGQWQNETGKGSCKAVLPGHEETPDGVLQLKCLPGRYGTGGVKRCRTCKSGQYQNQPASISCKNVSAGHESDSSRTLELACVPGKFGIGGSASCMHCPGGKYQDKSLATSCKPCAQGDGTNQGSGNGSTSCAKIPPGSYITSNQASIECGKGYKCQGEDSKPEQCDRGTFQDNTGQRVCLDCSSGMYNNKMGSDKCLNCQPGFYRSGQTKDRTTCIPTQKGFYVSSPGSSFELECSAGSYADVEGLDACKICPMGWLQKEKRGVNCQRCQDDRTSNDIRTDCLKPDYKVPSDCDDESYLDMSNSDRQLHKCETCPSGGYCVGPSYFFDGRGGAASLNFTASKDQHTIRPKFGYSRCRTTTTRPSFEKCSFPAAYVKEVVVVLLLLLCV